MIIDAVIAIVLGFLGGLIWIWWKKQTIKLTIAFFAIVWIFFKSIRCFYGPSYIQAFMDLAALFAIFGAIAAYLINRYVIKEKKSKIDKPVDVTIVADKLVKKKQKKRLKENHKKRKGAK